LRKGNYYLKLASAQSRFVPDIGLDLKEFIPFKSFGSPDLIRDILQEEFAEQSRKGLFFGSLCDRG